MQSTLDSTQLLARRESAEVVRLCSAAQRAQRASNLLGLMRARRKNVSLLSAQPDC